MIHKILNRFDRNHVVDHNHNHHFRIGWINSGADGHILGRGVRLDRDVRHSPDARNCFGHCVDLECLHTNRNFDPRSLFFMLSRKYRRRFSSGYFFHTYF